MRLVVFERRQPDARGSQRGEIGSMGAAALGFETLEAVRHGARRMGALVPSGPHAGAVVDLNRALAVKLAFEDAGAPECEADSLLPSAPPAFLRRLPLSLDAARETISFVADALGRYDGPDLAGAEIALSRRQVRLVAPVQRPGKLLAVRDVAGREAPEPFLKAPSALAGPEDELVLPPVKSPLTFHGELALVIGRRLHDAGPEEALAAVAGYCTAISVHPLEQGEANATLGWSGDGFAPLGPSLVTPDEVGDPHDLRVHVQLSGETVQRGHTKELPLPVPELVARLSSALTLEPGDVVLCGATRGGGGASPRALRDGDVLEVEIERVGRLAIYVKARPRRAARSG